MHFSRAERPREAGDGPLPDRPAEIETQRLVLLPLGTEHADALLAALHDTEVYRYVPGDAPRDVRVLQQRYRRTSAGPGKPAERWWNWAVATRERAASPFGTVEMSLNESGVGALLGYMFGCAAWGHGYAFEACNAAIAYVRGTARTEHVDAYVDTRNARSIRLAERLGMQRIETIMNADYFKGSASNEYHYRRTFADRGSTAR